MTLHHTTRSSQAKIVFSIVENEHTRRVLLQRLNDVETRFLNVEKAEASISADTFRLAKVESEDKSVIYRGSSSDNYCNGKDSRKKRAVENTDLHIVRSRLSDSEFDQPYAS